MYFNFTYLDSDPKKITLLSSAVVAAPINLHYDMTKSFQVLLPKGSPVSLLQIQNNLIILSYETTELSLTNDESVILFASDLY